MQDGINGLLLDAPTSDAIIAALRSGLRNPARLEALAARSRVADPFTIGALGERLRALVA